MEKQFVEEERRWLLKEESFDKEVLLEKEKELNKAKRKKELYKKDMAYDSEEEREWIAKNKAKWEEHMEMRRREKFKCK